MTDQENHYAERMLRRDQAKRLTGDEASAPEGLDFGRFLFEQANALNVQLQSGLQYGHDVAARDMRGLFVAYDRALVDPAAKIPTPLHLAIESLRKKYAP